MFLKMEGKVPPSLCFPSCLWREKECSGNNTRVGDIQTSLPVKRLLSPGVTTGERPRVRGIKLMVNSKRTTLARNLRRKQTDAERKLWSILRGRQFENSKFRRQEPIGKYIVDFVSLERELIIELDGWQHNQQSEMEKDETRTKWLERKGFRVLRFWNNDVLQNIDGVGSKILEIINNNG